MDNIRYIPVQRYIIKRLFNDFLDAVAKDGYQKLEYNLYRQIKDYVTIKLSTDPTTIACIGISDNYIYLNEDKIEIPFDLSNIENEKSFQNIIYKNILQTEYIENYEKIKEIIHANCYKGLIPTGKVFVNIIDKYNIFTEEVLSNIIVYDKLGLIYYEFPKDGYSYHYILDEIKLLPKTYIRIFTKQADGAVKPIVIESNISLEEREEIEVLNNFSYTNSSAINYSECGNSNAISYSNYTPEYTPNWYGSNYISAKCDMIKESKKGKEKKMKSFNFDFGPVKGDMIRMSIYGLAVKNAAGTYVSYVDDKLIDVDIMNFDGSKFIYKMPAAYKDISVGDVIVHNKIPMIVIKKFDNKINVIDPVEGSEKTILPLRSPFGFDFYTRIVNLVGGMMGDADSANPFGNPMTWMLMMSDNADIDPMMFFLMGQGNNLMQNPMMMYFLMKDGNKNDLLPFFFMQNAVAAKPTETAK